MNAHPSLTLGLIALPFAVGAPNNASADRPPNVLFIAIDDLNDWVGSLGGHPQAQTPNLDRLARRGVNFTNAHCQAPICNPSRVSLLTGKLPSSTGIYYLTPSHRAHAATRGLVTLPEHFQANGYRTLGVGKIFHGRPTEQEFEEYGGNFGGFGPLPDRRIAPAGATDWSRLWDWGPFPDSDEQMPDSQIADWAVDRLGQEYDRPFFLAVGFYRPHVPLFVPRKWFDEFPLDSIRLPVAEPQDLADVPRYARDLSWSGVAPRHEWVVENNQWERLVQAYLASVLFVDAQVGRVINALDQSRHADDTIVVLWSDHGFHNGTKSRWGKRSLWDDATRVVQMVSGPTVVKGGTCDAPVGLIDLYPTLVEICGLSPAGGLEGRSLAPLLRDPAAARERPALTTFGQNNHGVRSRDWRYIVYADGSEELYDHRSDPHEFTNLAGDARYAEVIAQHRRWLPKINVEKAPGSAHADARPGSAPDIDQQTRARRKARRR